MKLGIVGLPNVGKSTLFNAITNAGAQSANYPFCTIAVSYTHLISNEGFSTLTLISNEGHSCLCMCSGYCGERPILSRKD